MEIYIPVMKKATNLLGTVIVGLRHVQMLLNEGRFEEAILLFETTVQAFLTIEDSLNSLPDEISKNDVKPLTNKVRNGIKLVVAEYETKKYEKVKEILQFTLIPRCNKWQQELEKAFAVYVVS